MPAAPDTTKTPRCLHCLPLKEFQTSPIAWLAAHPIAWSSLDCPMLGKTRCCNDIRSILQNLGTICPPIFPPRWAGVCGKIWNYWVWRTCRGRYLLNYSNAWICTHRLTYTVDTCPHVGIDTTSVYEAAVCGLPSNCAPILMNVCVSRRDTTGLRWWKSSALDHVCAALCNFSTSPHSEGFSSSSLIAIYTSSFQLSVIPSRQPSGAPSPVSWVHC